MCVGDALALAGVAHPSRLFNQLVVKFDGLG
jgi:hypothetical protein